MNKLSPKYLYRVDIAYIYFAFCGTRTVPSGSFRYHDQPTMIYDLYSQSYLLSHTQFVVESQNASCIENI